MRTTSDWPFGRSDWVWQEPARGPRHRQCASLLKFSKTLIIIIAAIVLLLLLGNEPLPLDAITITINLINPEVDEKCVPKNCASIIIQEFKRRMDCPWRLSVEKIGRNPHHVSRLSRRIWCRQNLVTFDIPFNKRKAFVEQHYNHRESINDVSNSSWICQVLAKHFLLTTWSSEFLCIAQIQTVSRLSFFSKAHDLFIQNYLEWHDFREPSVSHIVTRSSQN